MALWVWLASGFFIIVGVIVFEFRWKRGRQRSLANTFHGDARPKTAKKQPLGMEATDMAGFQKAMESNRSKGFAQGLQAWKPFSHTAAWSKPPAPVTDDETYAARFHNAFGKPDKDQFNDRN